MLERGGLIVVTGNGSGKRTGPFRCVEYDLLKDCQGWDGTVCRRMSVVRFKYQI